MRKTNQLNDVDLHHIAQKSSICLNSRLVYIVPKLSNGWSDGEMTLLEKYLDYCATKAWVYNCIKWWEIPTDKTHASVTAHLTIKDIVLKFVRKDEQGKFVMKSIDEFDTSLYKHIGSRSGKRRLKKDLSQLRKRLVVWGILNS